MGVEVERGGKSAGGGGRRKKTRLEENRGFEYHSYEERLGL